MFLGSLIGIPVSAEEGEVVYFNNIEAEIEGSVITLQEVEMSASLLEPQVKGDEARKMALDSLVESEVIVREFERNQGHLPDNYVRKKYEEVLRTKFNNDPTKLAAALFAQGMTKRDYEEKIRKDAIEGYMVTRNVLVPSLVSPNAIQAYYEEHRDEMVAGERVTFDQIVITDENRLSLEAAVTDIQKMPSEALYMETCTKLENIPGVALNTMESILVSDIQPEIAQKIQAMEPHTFQYIEVGDYAFWVGLRNREPAHMLDIEEVSDRIKSVLIEQQSEQLKKHWIESLLAKAYYVVR